MLGVVIIGGCMVIFFVGYLFGVSIGTHRGRLETLRDIAVVKRKEP